VHPAVIAKELGDFLYRGEIAKEAVTVASGGFGIARYTRRWLRGYRPGQIMNGAYQYGAIGPDVGYAVGVAAAVQLGAGPQAAHQGTPVVCITGDAGFGYTAMEMETLSKYRLPVIVIVYNNNAWGTWTGSARDPKALPIHLFQENIRYDKVGEALGAHGEYVTEPGAFRPALARAWQVAVSRAAAIGDQLSGPERVLDAGSVPAGHARKDRAGVHVVLPLKCERPCGTTQTVECFEGSARRGGRAGRRSSGLCG
jgi:acetolactate synthase I/II/III large subunit